MKNETPVGEEDRQEESQDGMVVIARDLEQHHRRPVAEAAEPVPRPFPATVMWGLGGGALVGAIVGYAVAWLFFTGTLVLEGLESMFSMEPYAFYAFWIFVGLATGIIVIGVATILLASPET